LKELIVGLGIEFKSFAANMVDLSNSLMQ